MSIQLVTYANQTVAPTNDAIIYEKAVDQNGIFYGCNVTVTSNNVNITGGYGIVCGREFVINSESIAVTLAPSGTLEGRLYVRLDLADADAPIQLLTATGNTLPPLVQDADVNYTNGTYEMELATFTVGVSSLSDVVETFEEIKGTKEGYMNTVHKTLLWTNSAPTSDFVEQDIPLDLSSYDAVEIEAIDYKSYNNMMPSVTIPIGKSGNIIGLAGSNGSSAGIGYLLMRGCKAETNKVHFYYAAGVATNGSNWANNNGNCIPQRIYGIKWGGN